MIVGAGDVFDMEDAAASAATQARCFSPVPASIRKLRNLQGARIWSFSRRAYATEVIAAWKSGADFVKVFPCAQVGGESYIRALKGPFPSLPLIAAGGVNQTTASKFILAGAAALGIGGD